MADKKDAGRDLVHVDYKDNASASGDDKCAEIEWADKFDIRDSDVQCIEFPDKIIEGFAWRREYGEVGEILNQKQLVCL